jgi:hypothetical protein
MYIRFITLWWEVRRGVHYGLFGPAYECARDADVPLVLREALWTEIDWFEANLPVPERSSFLVKSRRRFRADGICWFTDSAREAIARAFAVAALLRDCGVPVAKVATHRPGQILYRDAWQIVAKPDEATPTTWH